MSGKKKRVREHVIADLSVNHVQYHLLKSGYTMDITKFDYGYDANVSTFDSNGEVENGVIFVQLKATDVILKHNKKKGYSYSISCKHLKQWCGEPFPVYLVLFDAVGEKAYWLYLQKYFRESRIDVNKVKSRSLTVHIAKDNIIDSQTPMLWRTAKEKILSQLMGTVIHD